MNKITVSIIYVFLITLNLLGYIYLGKNWLNMFAIGFITGLFLATITD